MQEYTVVLKNEKKGLYRSVTTLITFLHLIYFIFLVTNNIDRTAAIQFLLSAIIYIILTWVTKKMKGVPLKAWGIYVLFIIFWVKVKVFYMAILCLVLIILDILAGQPIVFLFTAELIKQQNFPWKKYHWEQLSNALLKDDILTMDFKNNKLIQAEIIPTDRTLDYSSFNEFAKTQITSHRK